MIVALHRVAIAGMLVLCAGSAAAAPRKARKPAPQPAPTKPVPAHACAPEYADAPELTVAGGKLVACWKRDPVSCIEFARGAAPLRLPLEEPRDKSPPPSAPRKPAPVRTAPVASVRDHAACAGATCVPLGPTVRAAIAAARAWSERSRYTAPRVSDDLRFLVVENQLFAIASDRRIAIAAPAALTGGGADWPRFAGVTLAGNLAIASWATCAGSCLTSAAVDDRGAPRSAPFPGGAPLVLDAKRVAILPLESPATVTILDRASGQPTGAAPIYDGISRGYFGVLADAQTLVALSATDAAPGWQIAWLAVPPGKPPSLLATQTIPLCP